MSPTRGLSISATKWSDSEITGGNVQVVLGMRGLTRGARN
jgi:hypothetical protein